MPSFSFSSDTLKILAGYKRIESRDFLALYVIASITLICYDSSSKNSSLIASSLCVDSIISTISPFTRNDPLLSS